MKNENHYMNMLDFLNGQLSQIEKAKSSKEFVTHEHKIGLCPEYKRPSHNPGHFEKIKVNHEDIFDARNILNKIKDYLENNAVINSQVLSHVERFCKSRVNSSTGCKSKGEQFMLHIVIAYIVNIRRGNRAIKGLEDALGRYGVKL